MLNLQKKKYKLQNILFYFIIFKIKKLIIFFKNLIINFEQLEILLPHINLIKYNFQNYIYYLNFTKKNLEQIKQLKILYKFFFKLKINLIDFNLKNSNELHKLNKYILKYIKFINIFLLKIIKKENIAITLKKKDQVLLNAKVIIAHRYLDYLQQNKLESFKELKELWKDRGVTKRHINKLQFINNPVKIWENSLYLYNNFPFFSINFFKKYNNIVILWLMHNKNMNRYNLKYRNIFIGYVKQIHSSFHNEYFNWLKENKKIIITLNVNKKKNNLYYTLNNKKGNTISNISVGIFYKLKRNLNLRKNPFKKSIEYLSHEMFLSIFYGKFVNLLKLNTIEKNEEYFKDNLIAKNIDREVKFYKNKYYYRKKHRIYFLFKYLKQKYYFPGLQHTLTMHVGNKLNNKLFSFIGIEKKIPRIHNGCRKKKIRRL